MSRELNDDGHDIRWTIYLTVLFHAYCLSIYLPISIVVNIDIPIFLNKTHSDKSSLLNGYSFLHAKSTFLISNHFTSLSFTKRNMSARKIDTLSLFCLISKS